MNRRWQKSRRKQKLDFLGQILETAKDIQRADHCTSLTPEKGQQNCVKPRTSGEITYNNESDLEDFEVNNEKEEIDFDEGLVKKQSKDVKDRNINDKDFQFHLDMFGLRPFEARENGKADAKEPHPEEAQSMESDYNVVSFKSMCKTLITNIEEPVDIVYNDSSETPEQYPASRHRRSDGDESMDIDDDEDDGGDDDDDDNDDADTDDEYDDDDDDDNDKDGGLETTDKCNDNIQDIDCDDADSQSEASDCVSSKSKQKHKRKCYHKEMETKIRKHIMEIELRMAVLKQKENQRRKRYTKCMNSTSVKEPFPTLKIQPIKRCKRLAEPIRCAVLKRHALRDAWLGGGGSCCGKGCWAKWKWVNIKRVLSDYW